MNVTQYTFQSPSPNQVQVGKPDTSSQKSEATSSDDSQVSDAKDFQASQTQEVQPIVDSEHTLDLYA